MEKRKYSRVSYQVEAIVKSKDVAITGKIDNLSMKGMFLNTESNVTNSDRMEITIFLSGSELSVNILGKAIRQTDKGIGIEFMEMDLDSFTHLKKIVAYNSPNSDDIEDEFYNSLDL